MDQNVNLDLIINLAAIILSVTAILLTIIGFFASLRFYRDGVELQSRVRELLSRVDEKVASVQSQVGGMFERTLDAVIGRSSPQAAAEEQKRLMREAGEAGAPEAPAGAQPAIPEPNLASKVMDYFAFKKLRYTDVTSGDARAVFMLGAAHGFNLFDGPSDIVFFGYFHELAAREIVARVRFLLNNIELAYKRIESATGELRDTAKKLLGMISVEVLVPETADKEQLLAAIKEYQQAPRAISVKFHKPSEILEAVEEEYAKIGI